MKKILHIITGLGAGGAEQVLQRIVTAKSSANGYHHVVVSLSDDGVYGASLRDANVRVDCLHINPKIPKISAIFKLASLVRREKPSVVMTWLYHADLMGTLAVLLSGVGLSRLVWNIRCSGMDLARYSRSTGSVLWLLAKISHLPSVITANSRAGQLYHEKLNYRPKRWAYLPNGFDTGEWYPDQTDREKVRAELSVSGQTFLVGMVARVDPMKDHGTFFAAAESLINQTDNIRFMLVGEGTDVLAVPEALKGKVTTLGQRRDLQRLLRGLDLLVLSSAFGEGFPNVIGEGMASALPCVVTSVGDGAQIVGDTGHVVAPRSPHDLSQAILSILKEPPGTRLERGERARLRIINEYSAEKSLQNFVDLWESVGSPAKG